MKTQSELHQLVYDFYLTRILFGYYRCGDTLPALPKISTYFHLSIPTVRMALNTLEKEGYIRIKAPKAAVVTYQASRYDYLKNISSYLLARKDGRRDMVQVNALLLGPLLTAGIRDWDELTWKARLEEIKNFDFDAMSLTIQLYTSALSALNNELILNFYWEINRYTRIPYLRSRRGLLNEMFERIESISKDAIGTHLTNELQIIYKNANSFLMKTIDEEYPELLKEKFSQIPFEWNLYYKRSQIRYTLATRIIQEILSRQYPIGSYLPSLPKLAKRYEVSLTTIRRTLALLSDFGVVKTYQGKGTLVCLGQVQVDLSQKEIRLAMKTFVESLQFLALTVRPVCFLTLRESSDESLEEFLAAIHGLSEEKNEHLAIAVCLTFLANHCPSPAVSHCYGKLMKCLAAGFPFTLFQLKREEILSLYPEFLLHTVERIKCRDFEGTAGLWEAFFSEQEQYFKAFIEGMKEGADRKQGTRFTKPDYE